ncbi:hypothetical protein C8R44DRAFT_728767 [Mycena epipterygia]|nr:hypothetical protein C8R44DRAFT_728767 [Mycena epipterygia]
MHSGYESILHLVSLNRQFVEILCIAGMASQTLLEIEIFNCLNCSGGFSASWPGESSRSMLVETLTEWKAISGAEQTSRVTTAGGSRQFMPPNEIEDMWGARSMMSPGEPAAVDGAAPHTWHRFRQASGVIGQCDEEYCDEYSDMWRFDEATVPKLNAVHPEPQLTKEDVLPSAAYVEELKNGDFNFRSTRFMELTYPIGVQIRFHCGRAPHSSKYHS